MRLFSSSPSSLGRVGRLSLEFFMPVAFRLGFLMLLFSKVTSVKGASVAEFFALPLRKCPTCIGDFAITNFLPTLSIMRDAQGARQASSAADERRRVISPRVAA